MTKKYKVYQWELFENYFKMPSSNEIDNCAMGPWGLGIYPKFPRGYFLSLKHMQQHLLVTFVDWAKLIFCDEHRTDGQTDVIVEIVM